MTGLQVTFRVFCARCLLLSLSPSTWLLAQVDVLNVNYDSQQTGANLQETSLSPGMNWRTFGKVGTFPVDGQVYAQPLYVSSVPIRGAKYNVVYVATMGNSVYAFDADAPQSAVPLWHVNLGPPVPSGLFGFTDILPQIGILGTPAIDPTAQTLYVVSDTVPPAASSEPVFQLHALSLVDGHEMLGGPVNVAASVMGTGAGSSGGTVAFDAFWQLQRPGLILANGTLYVAFGSHADTGNYHGWILGYNSSTLQLVSVFNSSPNGQRDAFWQSGRAPAVDSNGDLYAVTGNGDFDGASNFGETLLHLSGTDLSLVDWYTPDEWNDLNQQDWDLGSTGAILIPNTNLLLTGSKSGLLYLAQKNSLGHLGPDTTSTVQGTQVNTWGMFQMVLWSNPQISTLEPLIQGSAKTNAAPAPVSLLYEFDPDGFLKSFEIVGDQINSTIISDYLVDNAALYVGLSLSANGGQNGIVWLITGNAEAPGEPATLHALDAKDLDDELWNSDWNGARDQAGAFSKFAPPTVANGRVYVPTRSNAVVVYGTLTNSPLAGTAAISSVANSASYLAGAVSPGELVTVSGANFGPPAAVQGAVSGGSVANTLESTQVLFGGTASPLLYASSNQINAVVPFGVTGATAPVQVVYQGQTTASFSVSLQPASPALFSLNASGGGQGAILNQDGSVNGASNPASPGSVVVLFATGTGLTMPASTDGAITSPPLPEPLLPVSVTIDGRPAEILYAGAAPDLIAGVTQINVVVPDSLSPSPADSVVLTVGTFTSPSAVTVAIQ